MDTALPQKFPFILDRNLAKANFTENRVCTSCDTVVLASSIKNHHLRIVFLILIDPIHVDDIKFLLSLHEFACTGNKISSVIPGHTLRIASSIYIYIYI